MAQTPGTKRIIIEHVYPEIDCGAFPVKRVEGEVLKVSADIFADGHDQIRGLLLYRKAGKKAWLEVPLYFVNNDRWEGIFQVTETGFYEYTLEAWVDHFITWQKGLRAKFEANQNVKVEILEGINLLEETHKRAGSEIKSKIRNIINTLKNQDDQTSAVNMALSEETTSLAHSFPDRSNSTVYEKVLKVDVERKKALFSAWYELFPRSASPNPDSHGTFQDVENLLPEIQRMGFDILYLPPIHPIGIQFRKGKNNSAKAEPHEPGSPWAIGAEEGGHKAIHPQLGTLDDFKRLVKKAASMDIEIALDIAFQCSQDHPYVKEHPQWFKWRPDGTVQYAENPPKKYQDVLPINFETEDYVNLWNELKSVFEYWVEQGVKIFRVDNPHTKAFPFWQWVIAELRSKNPELIFLAEAFTRPRVMERLAKVGFTQSYTYYTWRNTREDFEQYLTELTKTERREYFRPNFWPNTPDILPVSLQHASEPGFIIRLTLAATMSSNFGIYGPVFEFNYNLPHPAREEYIDNEKYEIKYHDWHRMTKTKEIIIRLNKIRKENAALQTTWNIFFAGGENQNMICYAKTDDLKTNKIIVVVNLDPYHTQSGWFKIPLFDLDLAFDRPYQVLDLISGNQYQWNGEWNYVELNPYMLPMHVFKVTQD
jgi:starch synthase (maltosyl-transferring)